MRNSKTRKHDNNPLSLQLQELPREVAPERDLWSGIESRIQQPKKLLLAVAATISLMVISSLLVLVINSKPAEEKWATGMAETGAHDWQNQMTELHLMKANLQPTLEQQINSLDPVTRRVVAENLVIIEQARNNITDALQMQPQNAKLSSQYLQLWHQEMAMYRRISSYSYKM